MNANMMFDKLSEVIENVFDPSAKKMRELKDALAKDAVLQKVFFGADIVVNGGAVAVSSSKSAGVSVPRKTVKPADDENRCHALVFAFTDDHKPAQCIRKKHEGSGDFCRQHAQLDGTKCNDCSAHHGKDIVHGSKHEHLGTIDEPSYIFELPVAIAGLKRNLEKKQAKESGVEPSKPAGSKSSSGDKKERKPSANGFIFYRTENKTELRAKVETDYPELKGKELAQKIVSVAAEEWKALSDEEKAEWKAKAMEAKGINGESEPADAKKSETKKKEAKSEPAEDDEEASSESEEEVEEVEEVEEEETESGLVFNETEKVWVDGATNLFYESKGDEQPIGQVQRGKFMRFSIGK